MSIDVDRELDIANGYIRKKQSADDRGIEFKMSLMSWMQIQKAKTCFLSGLPLTNSSRTIDRIDSTIGYVDGNVRAVHSAINNIKSVVENPSNKIEFKHVERAMRKSIVEIRNVRKELGNG